MKCNALTNPALLQFHASLSQTRALVPEKIIRLSLETACGPPSHFPSLPVYAHVSDCSHLHVGR